MNIKPLGIEGAWLFTPTLHRDMRGLLYEWFRSDEIASCLGYTPSFLQGNCQVSRYGVIRGVHYTHAPPGQAKYVTCLSGGIFDVAVDLRTGSPTFGQWEGVLLDDIGCQGLYLAEGLGHAYMSLTDRAIGLYLSSALYDPSAERGIYPLDPALAITWPASNPVLSEKDAAALHFKEAQIQGLLPCYESAVNG